MRIGNFFKSDSKTTTVTKRPVTKPTTILQITSGNAFSVNEGVILNQTGTANKVVTWSKSGTGAAQVTLNATTGVWSLAAQNYDTTTSVTFTLIATDNLGAIATKVITITIIDVASNIPPEITSGGAFSVNEGVILNQTATASGSGTITWSKSGVDAGLITLNTTTGDWSLPAQDYALKTSVAFSLTATNSFGNDTEAVVVTINDVVQGGDTIDPTLSAPIISFVSAGNVYPPVLRAILDNTYTADTHGIQIRYDTSYNDLIANTPDVDTQSIITAAQANANAKNMSLSAIISPAQNHIRVRGYGPSGYSAWSNILLHGDIVAPNITSGNFMPVENQTTIGTVTFDKVCYLTVEAGFNVVGTQPALSYIITSNTPVDAEAAAFVLDGTATALNGLTAVLAATVTPADQDEIPTLGASFLFTDVTGVALNSSNAFSYTVAGLGAGVSVPFNSTVPVSKDGVGSVTSGTVTNGNVLAGNLAGSALYSTPTNVILTVGAGSDTFTATTMNDPALVGYTHVDVLSSSGAFGENNKVIPGFVVPSAGMAIIFVHAYSGGSSLSAVSLGGVACTFRDTQNASSGLLEVWTCAITAGTHSLSVTAPAGNLYKCTASVGVVPDGQFVATTKSAEFAGSGSNPTTPSLSKPATGGIIGALGAGFAALPINPLPVGVSPTTDIDYGEFDALFNGENRAILLSRITTTGSLTWNIGSFFQPWPRIALSFERLP